ncbi:MAG TPA: hypothetical protein VF683_09550 [Chthoniobacterales bacterium]
MDSLESETSRVNEAPLSLDLNLPIFTEPMREHWPSGISWEAAMEWFDCLRLSVPHPFTSAEERLRDKNPAPFRLP